MNSHETERDFDVICADFVLDDVQSLQRDGFGPLHVRASRSAQTQLKLTRVHPGENLRAEPLADENDSHNGGGEIRGHHEPARAHNSLRKAGIAPLKSRK